MEEEKISGEQAEAAVQQDEVTMEAQTEQEEEAEQMVPLSALQSERAQRQQKEQEAQLLRDNIALMQSNMQQQQKPAPVETGLDDSDLLTVGEAKKFMEKFNKNYELTIDEMRMMQKHPDYQEVITKFLPEVLKNNPKIQNTLRVTQDYELAYHIAKNSDAYRNSLKKTVHPDAEKIIKNSKKAGSLTSVGTASSINQTKRYIDMTDEEFAAEMDRNMGFV